MNDRGHDKIKSELITTASPVRDYALLRRPTGQVARAEAPSIVDEALHTPGQQLDQDTRSNMGHRFGHDFSQVRVHTDSKASESAQAINARAYTVGQDIVFDANHYAPNTSQGRRLLAHELTHVSQQGNRVSAGPAKLSANNDATLEHEAGAAADYVLAERAVSNVHQVASGALQRQEAEAGEKEEKKPPALKQFPGITTPLEETLKPGLGGEVGIDIAGIQVEVQPDAASKDKDMSNRAETTYQFNSFNVNYESAGGKITSFTGPETPKVTIQTTYGPGATEGMTSLYGKGTTEKEKKAKTTSLGYHEGSGHGRDFIQFLRDNPFPQFKGNVGMTVEKFKNAIEAYKKERAEFDKRMNRFSKSRTDCVGKTIDQFNAERGSKTSICKKM